MLPHRHCISSVRRYPTACGKLGVEEKENTLSCQLQAVEVMGRDVSVVANHPLCENTVIRAIIPSENKINTSTKDVYFELKKNKVFFHRFL